MPSSDIIWLIPTTLIESNAMKRLITLIFSAALLCPMWAGAQTATTPSIVGQIHLKGNIPLDSVNTPMPGMPAAIIGTLFPVPGMTCNSITDVRVNIQSPNNATPIHATNGYFTCTNGVSFWRPFSGTLIAQTFGGDPVTNSSTVASYEGNFNLGVVQMRCIIGADTFESFCTLYTTNTTTGPIQLGKSAYLYYTSAP